MKLESTSEATKLGIKAETIVHNYLTRNNWVVTSRSKIKGRKTGFDFRAEKDGQVMLIEVKGTKYDFKVPDLHETEFDPMRKRFVATHLFVVGNLGASNPPILSIVKTDDIHKKLASGEIEVKKKIVVKGYKFNKVKDMASQAILTKSDYEKII